MRDDVNQVMGPASDRTSDDEDQPLDLSQKEVCDIEDQPLDLSQKTGRTESSTDEMSGQEIPQQGSTTREEGSAGLGSSSQAASGSREYVLAESGGDQGIPYDHRRLYFREIRHHKRYSKAEVRALLKAVLYKRNFRMYQLRDEGHTVSNVAEAMQFGLLLWASTDTAVGESSILEKFTEVMPRGAAYRDPSSLKRKWEHCMRSPESWQETLNLLNSEKDFSDMRKRLEELGSCYRFKSPALKRKWSKEPESKKLDAGPVGAEGNERETPRGHFLQPILNYWEQRSQQEK